MQLKAGRVAYVDYHDQDDKSCSVRTLFCPLLKAR